MVSIQHLRVTVTKTDWCMYSDIDVTLAVTKQLLHEFLKQPFSDDLPALLLRARLMPAKFLNILVT